MLTGALADASGTSFSIADLAAVPPGTDFDPAAIAWVSHVLGDGPINEAATASAVSRLPENMVALIRAYFVYRCTPTLPTKGRLLDAGRAVSIARSIADVKGSA